MVMKRNEVVTHALAWINFENMLYERSQAHTHTRRDSHAQRETQKH